MAKKRLTKFLCKELLYDYLSGQLDETRQIQVQDLLDKDEDLKNELKILSDALQYTTSLKKITVSQPYYQDLIQHFQTEGKTYYIKKAAYTSTKWLGAAAVVALLYMYFPTGKIIDYFQRDPNKIVLAEVKTSDAVAKLEENFHGNDMEEPESVLTQEEVEAEDREVKIAEQETKVALNVEEAKKLKLDLKKQEEDLRLAAEVEAKKPVDPVVVEKPKKKLSGLLYRVFLKVPNEVQVSEAILQKIKNLAGEKAGSVNLGWRKPNGNSYFHFSMTNSNFEIFKTYLRTITQVEINSYPHPRVMPDGYMRMILEVQNIQ